LDSSKIEQAARKLILERPRKLQEALVKNTREAYSHYTDEQLATLLAGKRINDYKTALINRAVQSIYSFGSTVWIIEQDRHNRETLAGLPCVEQHLANIISLEIAQGMLSEAVA
jgi:glutamate synthase (NADPH/NADH) large chain